VTCQHPAKKLNTIPNAGSLSASDTSNAASFASKTTAPVTDLAPLIPNATSEAASSNASKTTTPAPNHNPPPERHHPIDPKELWSLTDTKTPLTKIMHSIVYLFFKKQTNFNWLRSCPNPFKLLQSYASRSQILATQNPNQQKMGVWKNTPPWLTLSYTPPETDKQSLFSAIKASAKVFTALFSNKSLGQSLYCTTRELFISKGAN
jgi:hypothetical protein